MVDTENFIRIIILAIFLYISYVYNEIFTRPNGIFTCLEQVNIDFFFYLCFSQKYTHKRHP